MTITAETAQSMRVPTALPRRHYGLAELKYFDHVLEPGRNRVVEPGKVSIDGWTLWNETGLFCAKTLEELLFSLPTGAEASLDELSCLVWLGKYPNGGDAGTIALRFAQADCSITWYGEQHCSAWYESEQILQYCHGLPKPKSGMSSVALTDPVPSHWSSLAAALMNPDRQATFLYSLASLAAGTALGWALHG